MTPAKIAAARTLERVVDDTQPGSLTSHLNRLERHWRADNDQVEQARFRRLTNAELASLGIDLDGGQ